MSRCGLVAWSGGPCCGLDANHEGEHVTALPASCGNPASAYKWTAVGPFVECSCCKRKVDAAMLSPGYIETCTSCASSFSAYGCGS